VADREHFVDHQNLGLEVRSNRKGQAQSHSTGIAFDRGVDELAYIREVDNVVELAIDLSPGHSEDCAVQIDVLPSGQVEMEASAHFQQTRHAAVDPRNAARWLRDPRQYFQKC